MASNNRSQTDLSTANKSQVYRHNFKTIEKQPHSEFWVGGCPRYFHVPAAFFVEAAVAPAHLYPTCIPHLYTCRISRCGVWPSSRHPDHTSSLHDEPSPQPSPSSPQDDPSPQITTAVSLTSPALSPTSSIHDEPSPQPPQLSP